MFQGYCPIKDYYRAIEYEREVLVSARRRGNRNVKRRVAFSFIPAKLHHCKGTYQKAKELYSKVLSFMVDAGEKPLELSCYGILRTLHWSMGKYSEAKEYLEKHLPYISYRNRRPEQTILVLHRARSTYDCKGNW